MSRRSHDLGHPPAVHVSHTQSHSNTVVLKFRLIHLGGPVCLSGSSVRIRPEIRLTKHTQQQEEVRVVSLCVCVCVRKRERGRDGALGCMHLHTFEHSVCEHCLASKESSRQATLFLSSKSSNHSSQSFY